MMKKTVTLVATSITLAALAMPSFASTMALSSGPYAEGHIGYANVRESVSGSTKEETTGVGLGINGGYKFNPNMAVELGVARYPNEDFGTAEGSNNYGGILAVKGILPFDNSFESFAKLGAALMRHDFKGKGGHSYSGEGSHTAAALFLGIGIAYAFNPHLQGILQADTTTSNGDVPGMHALTVGMIYFL